MTKEECMKSLTEILRVKFDVPLQLFTQERMGLPLLDKSWGLSSISWVYFILEIEKKFAVSISPDYLKKNYALTLDELSEKFVATN